MFTDGSPAVRKSLFNVQLCRYLVVITGVGSVVLYSFPGNHVHLQEGALESLRMMNLRDPEELMKKKPYELSGGMCQRVMIAIAMSMKPDYLIADEPTTALDVTVQKQILEEIYQLSRKENLGVLFITHDLGVVAEIADDVSIMKDGEIVENGTVEDIFYHPQHSYTKKLLDAVL